jgi:hypothetical protein
MVRPRHRGNRLLHLPGISADPRARALATTLAVTPQAHSEKPPLLFLVIVLRGVHLYFSVFVILLRVPFLSPTCESLYCASFIYSPPSYVTRIVCLARPSSICFLCSSFHCASPFYLLLVSHCIARPSSIRLLLLSLGLFVLRVVHLSVSYVRHSVDCACTSVVCLSCAHFCLVVHRGRRGEERGSDSLASWEDKRMDVVASSWRYLSTQSIISLHTPTFHTSVNRRCDQPE